MEELRQLVYEWYDTADYYFNRAEELDNIGSKEEAKYCLARASGIVDVLNALDLYIN